VETSRRSNHASLLSAFPCTRHSNATRHEDNAPSLRANPAPGGTHGLKPNSLESSQRRELLYIIASHRTERATLCIGSFASASQFRLADVPAAAAGFWGAQAASLQRLAACRTPSVHDVNGPKRGWRQSCRQLQAGSLCSPEPRAALLSFPAGACLRVAAKQKGSPVSRGASRFRGL